MISKEFARFKKNENFNILVLGKKLLLIRGGVLFFIYKKLLFHKLSCFIYKFIKKIYSLGLIDIIGNLFCAYVSLNVKRKKVIRSKVFYKINIFFSKLVLFIN